MLVDYIRASMKLAKYEILSDDGTFYGEIPGFDGIYANANTLEACRDELESVLEEWILFRVSRNLPLPIVTGQGLMIIPFTDDPISSSKGMLKDTNVSTKSYLKAKEEDKQLEQLSIEISERN
jgi:predicted RNase H-like HicB family nuclease